MPGETGALQLVPGNAELDPSGILRATVDALGRMDVCELERLSREAETMARVRMRAAGEAIALKDALGELLQSTERSLRMLRGLHETGVRRVEEVTPWER